MDLVRAIPVDRVMAVQMNDGLLVPELDSYYEECLRRRLPPGEGEMDPAGFLADLIGRGVATPWSLEVCSEAGWAAPAVDQARRCGDGMRAVLADARTRIDRGVSS